MQSGQIKFIMPASLKKLIDKTEELQKTLFSIYAVQIPDQETLNQINEAHAEHNTKLVDLKAHYSKLRDETNDPKKWEELWQTQAILQAKLMIKYKQKEIEILRKLRIKNNNNICPTPINNNKKITPTLLLELKKKPKK